MIGHRNRFRFTAMARSSRKRKAAIFLICPLITREIMSSKDAQCNTYGLLTRSRYCWILAEFFFCVFMDQDGVEVHKHAKESTRPISSNHDRTSLVNKGFIIWLSGKFFLRDKAGSLERAR